MSMNNVVLIGRITKDIEKKTTQSGVSVLNTTIAVDRDYKQGDEKICDFIDLVIWRHNADYIEKYASKGAMIAIVGKLQSRKWQDKDGNNRTSWEVQCDNVQIVSSKRDGSAQPAPSGSAPAETAPAETAGDFAEISDSDGDLPF